MLWLLTACWEPTETSESGMVGRVLDPTGFPIKDVAVFSLEGRAITDSAGHFAVEYQAPDTHVSFDIGQTHFRRAYRPEDDGGSVDLRIPSLRDVAVRCETSCNGRLLWPEVDGLQARATVECSPERELTLGGVPVGLPELGCASGEASLRERDGSWVIGPPLRQLTVAAPAPCAVTIDDRIARREGDRYSAQVSGEVVVRATCSGVPQIPQRASEGEVVIVPSDGWHLDLGVDAGRSFQLISRPTEGDSFLLDIASDDGGVVLPELPPGVYVIVGPEAPALSVQPTAEEVASLQAGQAKAAGPDRWLLRIDTPAGE